MIVNPFDLTGRTAIVTGAGSGIGRGIAQALSNVGASVICADIDGDRATQTADELKQTGGSAEPVSVDVTSRLSVAEMVGQAVSTFGQLDIMCNNAGIIFDAPVLDLSEADLDRVLAVNLKGVLFGCQEAAPVMIQKGYGSIVNIASTAIDGSTPNLVAYGISKVGVVQLTRTLAAEVGSHGVRVNAIAPGLVDTNITVRRYTDDRGEVDEAKRGAFLGASRDRTALRLDGTPEDMGWAAVYLASDASRFVTGQIIRPNGGASMPW